MRFDGVDNSLSFSTSLQVKLKKFPNSRSVGCFMLLKFSVLNEALFMS